MSTLTKAHIVERLHEELEPLYGYSRPECATLVETLFELMRETLENNEDILISGFGKFCVKEKHPRRGRNPHSGEEMMLPARRVVTFKCSGVLREEVNRQGWES